MDMKENVTLLLNLPVACLIIHYHENLGYVSRAALVICCNNEIICLSSFFSCKAFCAFEYRE